MQEMQEMQEMQLDASSRQIIFVGGKTGLHYAMETRLGACSGDA